MHPSSTFLCRERGKKTSYDDSGNPQHTDAISTISIDVLKSDAKAPLGKLEVTDEKVRRLSFSEDSSFIDPIRRHRVERWVVEADSGRRVVVRAEAVSDGFDAVLYVVHDSVLYYSDDEGPETNSFVEFDMPSSGQVNVLAGSYWPKVGGEYRLRVDGPNNLLTKERKSLGPLKLTDEISNDSEYRLSDDSSFIDPLRGHRVRMWAMEADSGRRVVVRAESDDFDAVLYVVHEDSVLYSDNKGPGNGTFIEFDMPFSGQVNILAGSYLPNSRGDYRLRVDYPVDFLRGEEGRLLGTLLDTLELGQSRQYHIGNGFVDPIRGHLLQRWVVEAESGSRVVVRAESDDFDAVLYVVQGNSVLYSDDEELQTDSFVEFDMPSSGQVNVLAGSYSDKDRGAYWLRVDSPARFPLGEATDPLGTLALTSQISSASVSRRLSEGSSFVDPIRGHHLQRWVVEAESGRRVVVRAEAVSDGFDAVLYVVHEDSTLYSDDEELQTDSFVEFDMPSSGEVNVLAGSYSVDAEGEYRLRAYYPARFLLGEATDPLGTLALTSQISSASVSRRLSEGSSFVDPIRGHRLQRWVVEADSGRRVVVRAEAVSDGFDAVLYVVHEDSVWYSDQSSGRNSQLEFDMPSGRMNVLVGRYSPDAEGEYRLRAYYPARFLLDEATDPLGTLALTPQISSASVSRRLSEGSSFADPIRGHRLQRWVVEAGSGRRVVVRAEAVSDGFDAVLYVVHGDSVLYSDDEGSGRNSRLEFDMPSSGRVNVLAGNYSADAEGEYRLQADYPAHILLGDAGDPLGTVDLTDGVSSDTVSRRLSEGSSFVDPIRGHRLQRWVVTANSNSRVVVRAEAVSDGFDAVLYVVHGDSVLYSDDEGSGRNSRLEFDMPSSERVNILAGSYLADAEGEYRLRVESGSVSPRL